MDEAAVANRSNAFYTVRFLTRLVMIEDMETRQLGDSQPDL